MPHYHYGLENPYGLRALNTSRGGRQANRIYRFPSKKQRTAWIRERRSHRQALKANTPQVRKAKQYAKLGLEWPISTSD